MPCSPIQHFTTQMAMKNSGHHSNYSFAASSSRSVAVGVSSLCGRK